MKLLKVKSNFARSKALVLGARGELVLHFDRDGIATFPEHLLPLLKAEMRAKPGRFQIIEDVPRPVQEMREEQRKAFSHQVKDLLDKLKKEHVEEKEASEDSAAKAEDASEELDEPQEVDESGDFEELN